jgi:hypothetical protein
VNDWNRDKNYTKAFLDKDGDPNLEMDLDLAGGVTVARVKDAISTFEQSLKAFQKMLADLDPR